MSKPAGKTTVTSAKARKQRRIRAKKRRQRRVIGAVCAALCLVLLCGALLERSLREHEIDAIPSDVDDTGLVRVFLRSLGNPSALGLTLDGVYTVDGDAGFRFARGTEIAVAEDEGSLLLSVGGLTLDMGGSFRLTRQAPDAGDPDGGLYIHESEKDNLYPCDLLLNGVGGGIECVATVQVEDYLCGVVGYEMSDSFPLEALKAQAIAARTYALNAKRKNASKAYDVMDTTADQVYKGTDDALKNIKKAVSSTRGIVCMTGDGKYAECYYTASNGGQIAASGQIWTNDVPYIEMKDDPYDLENPLSVVKSAFVPEKIDETHPLYAALLDKLDIAGAVETRIDRISAIVPAEPDREGSRMFASLDFTVEVSRKTAEIVQPEATDPLQPAPTPYTVVSDFTPLEEPVTLRLSAYHEVKNLLNIGINGGSYELFTVEEADGGYTVAARRFGHGCGMSQRGAQTMAGRHDMLCEDIIAFYYPGVTLNRIDWNTPALTPLSALPDSVGAARAKPTPRPTQQPLPPLTGDEYYATVRLQSAASTLNVRSQPNTASSIAALLYNGERVIVTSAEADDWFGIKTVEFTGFVKGDYIEAD